MSNQVKPMDNNVAYEMIRELARNNDSASILNNFTREQILFAFNRISANYNLTKGAVSTAPGWTMVVKFCKEEVSRLNNKSNVEISSLYDEIVNM